MLYTHHTQRNFSVRRPEAVQPTPPSPPCLRKTPALQPHPIHTRLPTPPSLTTSPHHLREPNTSKSHPKTTAHCTALPASFLATQVKSLQSSCAVQRAFPLPPHAAPTAIPFRLARTLEWRVSVDKWPDKWPDIGDAPSSVSTGRVGGEGAGRATARKGIVDMAMLGRWGLVGVSGGKGRGALFV